MNRSRKRNQKKPFLTGNKRDYSKVISRGFGCHYEYYPGLGNMLVYDDGSVAQLTERGELVMKWPSMEEYQKYCLTRDMRHSKPFPMLCPSFDPFRSGERLFIINKPKEIHHALDGRIQYGHNQREESTQV